MLQRIYLKIKDIFFGTGVRGFITVYALFTLLGALLLELPISVRPGQKLPFIDALFISVSGISTTGLSTVDISQVLTKTGQVILAVILQFGGIGLIMLIAIFWMMMGKKLGFKEQNMIMQDQNQVTMDGVVRLVKNILIILFVIESLAIITFSIYFIVTKADGMATPFHSIFNAFFLTVSLLTNAGFDITGTSLKTYSNDYFVQSLAMFLMFVGGVGFWPLIEIKDFFFKSKKRRVKGKKFRFSTFSKILISSHIIMWVAGAGIMYLIEKSYGNFLQDKGFIESVYYCAFMSLSTRNAGFATVDMSRLDPATHMLFIVLMFVGSAPNSAGGGIRTTTIVVIFATIYSYAIGRDQTIVERRSIKQDSVIKAYTIFVSAIMLCFFATFVLLLLERDNPLFVDNGLSKALFEVVSAFGTTGLSLGITASLGIDSKMILIITMFIGRIGIITIIYLLRKNEDQNQIKYPDIDLIIG